MTNANWKNLRDFVSDFFCEVLYRGILTLFALFFFIVMPFMPQWTLLRMREIVEDWVKIDARHR